MLEMAEEALIQQAHLGGLPVVEEEAHRRGQVLQLMQLDRIAQRFQPMLEMYKLLTGFEETNPNAVAHHKVAYYGPPCPQCYKPLRTPAARFCAACGFGQDDTNAGSLPLVQRHPEFFKDEE